MSRKKPVITPDTKVAELLDSYPDLEETLVGLAPAFAKLRNPILRRTVAKVTSLRQAAKVGGISLGKMINELRSAAGLGEEFLETEEPHEVQQCPDWFDSSKVTRKVDLRPVLERGEKPLGLVMGHLGETRAGQIYQITTPFVPAPLIDVARARGFEAWWVEEGAELCQVFFCKAEEPGEGAGPDSSLVDLE
jgi:hypothetical protein